MKDKTALVKELQTLRAEELKECQQKLEDLLKEYNVSLGFDLVYVGEKLKTKIYIKDDSGLS